MALPKLLPFRDDRTYRLKATPDQIWAFDADYLRRKAEALRPVGRHYTMRIRLYTISFYMLLKAAAFAAFMTHWWVAFVLLGLACLQRQANYRLAGKLAAEAASASTDMFLHLYNIGALSVEEAPNAAALALQKQEENTTPSASILGRLSRWRSLSAPKDV
ncbi:MAG: hypothetical protein AAGJ85_08165 [Pseudomonadota bacterium]